MGYHNLSRLVAGLPFGKSAGDEFAEVTETGRYRLSELGHVGASVVCHVCGVYGYAGRCACFAGRLVSGLCCRCGCRCGLLGLFCGYVSGKVGVNRSGFHTGLPFGLRLLVLYGLDSGRCGGCCGVRYVVRHSSQRSGRIRG